MTWKRRIGWLLAGFAALLSLVTIGAYVYLRSASFQQFALRKIVQEVDTSTGGHAEIGGLDFRLSTLTAHLYNITLHGTEDTAQPPLLHADRLTVGLKIVSAMHRQGTVRELLIDHPVVYIRVSSEGKNNLPAPPSASSSNASVFDLGVGHAAITNGEINYNDRKIPLEADLHDLGTDVHFESTGKRYIGSFSYKDGQLRYAQYASIPHNLNLKFSADPQKFEIAPAVLNVGSSQVNLEARVSNYSNPVADAVYHFRIHAQDFADLSPSVRPSGDVTTDGRLHYQSAANQPLLRCVTLDGTIASDFLSAIASGKRVESRNVTGTYHVARGNLLTDLKLNSMGGLLAARARMQHLDATPDATIVASLSAISLRAIQRTVGQQGMQATNLSGTLNGKVTASWKGSVSNLRAHSDIAVQARARNTANASAQEVPVNGEIHADYDGPRQTIEVHNTTVRIPAANLTAEGTVGDRSHLQLQLTANDLHQLAAVALSFHPTQFTVPSISGSATVSAVVAGAIKRPSIHAQLDARNLEIEGSQWKRASVTMNTDPSRVTIDRASLVNAHEGDATLSASVQLKNWVYDASAPLDARLAVQRLRLADLQALAKQQYPISGDLSANLTLHGSQQQPVGSGSLQITNASAYGEPLQSANVTFHAQNGVILTNLKLVTAAGGVNGDLSFTPQTKAYKVRLDVPSLVLQKLRTVQEKSVGLIGTLSASVSGEGTLDNPQLSATVQLPLVQVRQNSISGLKADIRVAQHQAELNLNTNVAQATIRAHGTVALTGDYDANIAIDTGTIALGTLVATYAPSLPQGFQGQTELHATLKGPLKDKSHLEAHLSIPVLKASYQSLQIAAATPIRMDYANSVVTLQPADIEGTGTSLRAQGRVPIGGTEPPTLTAQGTIDAHMIQLLSPSVKSAGTVALDVRSSGAQLQGQVQFKDISMTTANAPIGVEKLNGTINIDNSHAQIANLTALLGGGQVSLGGSVSYRPSIAFNLAVQGQSVRLRYPDGLRSVLNANLAYSGTTKASTLSGRVLIDSLSFTPDFDLSNFADQFSTGNTVSQPGFGDTVKLAINVQSQQNLNATSSQISIAGQAALQVGGTAADPVITGRTTLTSGELFYRNVRYALQRGIITFDDPNETHPVLNVSATTTVEQYNLTLTLRGPLDKLTTSYVSEPPLATADIINLVARGKTTEEQAASSQSTDSMIASQVAGQLSSSVQKLAGLSSLQIDPTLGGNNANPSARVAIQQRVTKNLLFSFSTDVSQPGSEIVQGEYQVTKRWSVSVERDQLGGVSVDGRFHTKF